MLGQTIFHAEHKFEKMFGQYADSRQKKHLAHYNHLIVRAYTPITPVRKNGSIGKKTFSAIIDSI